MKECYLFRRRLLSVLLVVVFPALLQAQITYLANEPFSKTLPQGWSVIPASTPTLPTWECASGVTTSAKYAMRAYVPFNEGDSVELVTPFYNCTNYKYVMLKFNHICKVYPADECQVMFQEGQVGSQWKPIPVDAYRGRSPGYRKALTFSHNDYAEWQAADSFATAASGWYMEEVFDLSNYASYSTVRFKFIIRKGSFFNSFIADGWYVDDFQLFAHESMFLASPDVEIVSVYQPVQNTTGPFCINAKVATRTAAPIVRPWLHYSSTYNQVTASDSIAMTPMDGGDSLWTATIPQHLYGTDISYFIQGRDTLGNTAKDNGFFQLRMPSVSYDSNAAALYAVENPKDAVLSGRQPVIVNVKNKGLNNLTSLQVGWSVNGDVQTPRTWRGNLPCDFNDTLTLGYYMQSSGKYDTIMAWVSMPNNMADPITADDTLSVFAYGCDSALHGKYTIGIGGTHDFGSVREALFKLFTCGMDGDVEFRLASGVYRENIILGEKYVPVIGTHQLCFTSMAENADSVRILSGGDDFWIVNLAINNVIFKHLSFGDEDTVVPVFMLSRCDQIAICHCKMMCGKNSGIPLVTISESEHIRFIGNSLLNGYYGLYCYGVVNGSEDIVCDSNQFIESEGNNAYFQNMRNVRFAHNFLSAIESPAYYAALFSGIDTCRVEANVVRMRYTSANQYGFYVDLLDSASVICGNEIVIEGGGNETVGILFNRNTGAHVLHNSTLVYGDGMLYGIYYLPTTNAYAGVFRNNITVTYGKSAYPFYGSSGGISNSDIDYNCWWGTRWVAYVSQPVSDMKEFVRRVPSAVHDVYYRPQFKDSSASLDFVWRGNLACPLDSISLTAINGLRSGPFTVMGAWHKSFDKKTDLSVLDVLSPREFGLSTHDSIPVRIVLQNVGQDTVTSADVAFQLNGVASAPYVWRGRLLPMEKDTVTISSIRLNASDNRFAVYCSNPNGKEDVRTENDTISMHVNACGTALSGVYSVGDSLSDFKDVHDVLKVLKSCGVRGPVEFRIANGTYPGFTLKDSIYGSSAQHTITFRSAAGLCDSVVFAPREDGVSVTLEETSHLIFENLTFSGEKKGIEMYGRIRNLTIRGCAISASVANRGVYCAVYYDGEDSRNSLLDGVRLIGNRIAGGYANIMLFNACQGFNDIGKGAGVVVDSNQLQNAFRHGVLVDGYGNYRSFSHNTVVCDSVLTNYYAVQSYLSAFRHMEGNRIRLNGEWRLWGFLLGGSSREMGDTNTYPAMLCNNEIILQGTGPQVGIEIDRQCGKVEMVHNAVHCSSMNAINACGSVIHDVFPSVACNNIFSTVGGYSFVSIIGSAIPSSVIRDYNTYYYYAPSGVLLNVNGTLVPEFSMLYHADSLNDRHSTVANPNWKVENGLYPDISANYICPVYPGVLEDIDGKNRPALGTVRGCYHLENDSTDAALIAFEGWSSFTSATASPLYAVVENRGYKPIDSAMFTLWIDSVNYPQIRYLPAKPLYFQQRDTVLLGAFKLDEGLHSFTAVVRMEGDTNVWNDTLAEVRRICGHAIAGRYLIGNSPQADFTYDQLRDSLFRLMDDCGVSGDVTFAFESGEYNGALDLSEIGWAMGKHHLTVTSAAKNRDSVRISSAGPVLTLGSQNRNVTVEHLTMQYTVANSYVALLGGVQNVRLLHNNFIGDSTITGTVIIYCLATNPVNLCMVGNRVHGGGHGLLYVASQGVKSQLTIDSNEFTGQYTSGVNIEDAVINSLSHNYVCSRREGSDNFQGIYLASCSVDSLAGNRVHATGNGGIHLRKCRRSDGGRCFVANNAVRLHSNGIESSGVMVFDSPVDFLHNTIYRTGTDDGYAFYGNNYYDFQSSRIIGNLFVVEKIDQCPIYLKDTGIYVTDYNNYYGGNTVAHIGDNTVCSTLAQLRTVNGTDAHSVSAIVYFRNLLQDLSIQSGSPVFMPRLAGVHTDINNHPRDAVCTVMGAYEMDVVTLDAALRDFAQTSVQLGNTAVSVTLNNCGSDTLTSASIHWMANGVVQTPVQWKGRLACGESAVVPLGSFNGQPFANSLVAYVCNPNQGVDTVSANDTVSLSVFLCSGPLAAGSYTVGGQQADFHTLEFMKDALYRCGISGPVSIRFRPGVYGTLDLSGKVPGSDTVNRVSFMADSGTVEFNSQYGLVLRNVSHMVFRGLVFGDTLEGVEGVCMDGACADVTFRECRMRASTATTAYNAAFRYINGNAVKIKLVSNLLLGGYSSINIGGIGAAASNDVDIVIDSNEMKGSFNCGIKFNGDWRSSSISFNTIHLGKNERNPEVVYGMYLPGTGYFDRVEGNRLLIENVSGRACGIYLAGPLNNVGTVKLIINNDIRVSSGGDAEGIYALLIQSTLDMHHNSLLVKSRNGHAYGIWTGVQFATIGTNQNNRITRNLIVSEGNTESYPLYIVTTSLLAPQMPRPVNYGCNYTKRFYNNLYSNPYIAYTQNMGNNSHATIGSLQAVTQQDSFSVSVRPCFIDTAISLALSDYDSLYCPSLPEVLYDIDGYVRRDTTSIGAYGVRGNESVNLRAIAFSSPKPVSGAECVPDSVPVSLIVSNVGYKTAYFDSSALRISLDITGAVTLHWDTLVTAGSLKHMEQRNFEMGMLPTLACGRLTLTATIVCAADSVPVDDTLSMVYKVSRVDVPYDADFSTEPDAFIKGAYWGCDGWQVVRDTGLHPSVNPVFGTGRLEFSGYGHSGATANAVFNGVDLQGYLNPTLSFWYAHDATNSKRDLMLVLASPDGGASYTEIGRITSLAAVSGWQQYDIDLSRFTNASCLSIVFQAISFGGANQRIDRIRIAADADAALSMVPVDFSALTACGNDAVPLRAVVSNQSALPFAYSSDTVCAEVTGAATQRFSYVYNKRLSGYESDTITLGNMDLRANGNYYFNIYMQSQDDNAQNDTIRDSALYVYQDIALDSIIGIDEQLSKLAGDTVWVSVLVNNKSNMAVDRFAVTMELDGEEVVSDTVTIRLGAGDSLLHAMSLPYVVPTGTKDQPFYFLEVTVSLPCDADASDNVLNIVGNIGVPDTVDLRVLSIAEPVTDLGRERVSPAIRVSNTGNADVQSVILHVEVMDSAWGTKDSLSECVGYIRSGDTVNHVFTLRYAVPDYDGYYFLRAYVDRWPDEIDAGNDTLTVRFRCRRNVTGVTGHYADAWEMGQNIPNPATEETSIPYRIPEAGRVVLSVMDVNGRVLYRETIESSAGANHCEVRVSELVAGIYYYAMEYKGNRQIRKLNVVK